MEHSISLKIDQKLKKPHVTLKKQGVGDNVSGQYSVLNINKSESQLPQIVDLQLQARTENNSKLGLPSKKHLQNSYSLKRNLEISQHTPFPIIQTHSTKNNIHKKGQKSLFAHKSLRENYGNFYKNLMKPQGGQILTKLYDTSSTIKKDSVFHMTNVDQTSVQNLDKPTINPYQQLKKAKENFVSVMMNLINSSDDQSVGAGATQLINEHCNSRNGVEQSRLTHSLERVGGDMSLEGYGQKLTKVVSYKEFMNEKPEHAYSQFVKNQNQHTQGNQTQSSYLPEKLTLKNHLKVFKEEQGLVEEISKNVEQPSSRENNERDRIFLNCFQNIEQKLGRKDIKTFEQIINDLIDEKIPLEALIDKEEIDRLSKSRFYTGFSLSQTVDETIKQAFEDEYDLNAKQIQRLCLQREYCEQINRSYIRHLKSYQEDIRAIKSLKQTLPNQNEPIASVIEQFKRQKAQQKHQQYHQNKDQDQGGVLNTTSEFISDSFSRNKSFIYYAALQEMIKQVYVNCKEKGQLFLKLFNKYFEEQEKHWSKIIFDFQAVLKSLRLDRDYLLNKYIDKNDKVVDNGVLKEELNGILENKNTSEENLIEHKRLIKQLIGFINREEDERYLLEVEKKNLESDIRLILNNWDLVRSNLDFKNRIKAVNSDKIKEEFMVNEQIRQMKKEDIAILINLERLRVALSNNGNLKWDLEKIQMECQNKVYRDESSVLKQENKKLREAHERMHELLNERSKENFDLTHQLKKFTDKLAIIDKLSRDVQTELSFKNEHFTTTMDQILQNKLNSKLTKVCKLKQKASANVQNLQPMDRQEMMDLIQGAYIKKSQEIGTKNELHFEFDDFVYSIMLQRFGTKKKVDIKGQEFFLALKKYHNEDERVDFFKHFVGFEEQNIYSRQVLEFYIKLMRTTNESVQNLMSSPNENDGRSPCQKVYIEYSQAIDKYETVFQNASAQLKEELKKHLIFDSELLIEGHPKMEVKLNEKWELYALLTFQKNILKEQTYTSNIEKLMIEKLQIDENQNIKKSIPLSEFQTLFESLLGSDDCRIIFDLVYKDEFYTKYFGKLIYVEEDNTSQYSGQKLITMKGINHLFREKYEFKITVRKFLDLGIKMSIRFLEEARVFYGKIFNIFDRDGDGFIEFKEFSKILKKVDPKKADWKIHAIFQKATNCEDPFLGQLNFDEFIRCALNNILMKDMIDWEQVLLEDKEKGGIGGSSDKQLPRVIPSNKKLQLVQGRTGRSISQMYMHSSQGGTHSLKSKESLQTIS